MNITEAFASISDAFAEAGREAERMATGLRQFQDAIGTEEENILAAAARSDLSLKDFTLRYYVLREEHPEYGFLDALAALSRSSPPRR